MNYSYDDNTKPYKLTGINNQPPTINSNQQTITYNSFNKVETITETDPATLDILRHLSLVYGAGNQRVKQSLSEQGLPTLTKMYVGGIYEKEIVDGVVKLVHYIYSPQGLTAIMERDAQGNDELNYVLTDHLGSVQVLASKTGALIEEYSYDAWGLRRDPGTLEVYTAATGTSVDYGFTGHEHLDAFMMINMNGRMYDPVIGRFISPDPVLQFPNNTQGLNPYSYALNNPLRFVDPSGYSLVGQLLALTAQIAFSAVGLPMVGLLVSSVVMTIDYAIENGRQVMNFSDLSAYFTQSMVISSISMGGTKVIGGTIKAGRELLRALAHATFNGTMRMAQGGKFEHGFLSGFVSSLLGSTINNNMSIGVKVAMSAAIGGTAEALGGGKFANGAVTGAYVMMFNHAMHQGQHQESNPHEAIERQLSEKISEAAKDTHEYFSDGETYYSRDTEFIMDFNIDGIEQDTRFQKDYNVVINIFDEDGVQQTLGVSVRTHLSTIEKNNVGYAFIGTGTRSGNGLHYNKGPVYEVFNRNKISVLAISFKSIEDKQSFNTYINGIWGQ